MVLIWNEMKVLGRVFMSHMGQVGTACEIGIVLNKECSFALLLQGGMVCSKWECKQPE
jgi:hypothetical protein